jgi:hypothetical protein
LRPRRRHFADGIAALTALVLLAACGTARDSSIYQETIGEFQSATDRTAAVALEHVRGINSFERGFELELLRDDADRPLNISKLASPVLSPEAIEARDRSFGVLKQYIQMLAALAESDASERWKAASERTKTAADSLLIHLEDEQSLLGNLPIAEIAPPLRAISGAATKAILEVDRDSALEAAIAAAAPPVQEISGLLREDLTFVVRQRDSVKQLEIAELTIHYTEAQQAGNNADRLKLLSKIEAALEARTRDLAALQGVIQTLDRFDAAHDALIRYATSAKEPQDLADLVVIVRSYADTADAVFQSFKATGDADS